MESFGSGSSIAEPVEPGVASSTGYSCCSAGRVPGTLGMPGGVALAGSGQLSEVFVPQSLQADCGSPCLLRYLSSVNLSALENLLSCFLSACIKKTPHQSFFLHPSPLGVCL